MFLGRQKPKQHLFSPRALVIIVVVCTIYLIRSASIGTDTPLSFNCERGLLKSVTGCQRDSAKNGEWNYSYATGPIDNALCDRMSLDPDVLAIPATSNKLSKVDCNTIKLDHTHFCYVSKQIMPKKIVVNSFTTNARCGDARFFSGVNIELIANTPTPMVPQKE